MDSVTHVVLGASVGELILGNRAGKKAMVFGAIAASLPDIDAVVNFFVSDVDSLLLHRGITHSVFTALMAGPLIGWCIWKYYKRLPGMLMPWILLFTVNILLHDLLDTCTMYGTALLLPFSNYRYSFDNIFVADPIYTLPLLISFIALVFLRGNHRLRKNWNMFGLTLSSIYMMITFINHNSAIAALRNSVDLKNKEYFAVPSLFNSLLWNVVVKDENNYLIGYYSIFDKSSTIELNSFSANNELINKIEDKNAVKKLKEFSKDFYILSERNDKIYFNDLRFGQIEGWKNTESGFAFSFDLTPGADNHLVVQAGRVEATKPEILKSMLLRILGFQAH